LEEVYRNPKGIHVALPWIVTRYSVFFFQIPRKYEVFNPSNVCCILYYMY
jgi:hypothetical protein